MVAESPLILGPEVRVQRLRAVLHTGSELLSASKSGNEELKVRSEGQHKCFVSDLL